MESVQPQKLKAVALQYSSSDNDLPRVTLSGNSVVAEKIIELAKEFDIPIYQDATLVQLLDTVKVGDIVPESSLELLTEMLLFLYEAEQQATELK